VKIFLSFYAWIWHKLWFKPRAGCKVMHTIRVYADFRYSILNFSYSEILIV
jgi:hypothetical protein